MAQLYFVIYYSVTLEIPFLRECSISRFNCFLSDRENINRDLPSFCCYIFMSLVTEWLNHRSLSAGLVCASDVSGSSAHACIAVIALVEMLTRFVLPAIINAVWETLHIRTAD